MEIRPFIDKTKQPTEILLKQSLGPVFTIYMKLISMTNGYKDEWSFSKSSGWMQKISDSKKALFYVIPLTNSFIVSLTIRESEKRFMANDKSLEPIVHMINVAKKYPEGYALKFIITDKKSWLHLKLLITKIMKLREKASFK